MWTTVSSDFQNKIPERPHSWNRWYAHFKKWAFWNPRRIRHCLIAVRMIPTSALCTSSFCWLLAVWIFAIHALTKEKYLIKKRIDIEKYVIQCLSSPYLYVFAYCSWESRSGEWSSGVNMKNNGEKWVERKKNRCFDNLCQIFFQRPASDLKYYADVGFGLQ